jgi:hypothetical protein
MVAALRRDTLYDLLAPPLILATAFVSFVNHNEYGYAAGEIWISFIGLAAAGLLCGLVMALDGQWLRILVTSGLLTLFVDLQFEWLDPPTYLRALSLGFGVVLLCWLLREHLSRITALVFATMLAADLLFPDGSGEWSANAPAPRVDAQTMAQPTPPVVVHLIFDEFIGVEGIPAEVPHGAAVARALRSFLHDAGFHVFARAYSRFDRTENSIPNMLKTMLQWLNNVTSINMDAGNLAPINTSKTCASVVMPSTYTSQTTWIFVLVTRARSHPAALFQVLV